MKPFSLYDEDIRTTTGASTKINPDQVEDGSMVEIDISEPNTLYTMSSQVRNALKDRPDNFELTVYLVCGNICSPDAGLFVDYLKDVTQPITVAFRGIIHFDFINLFLFNEVYLNQKSQIYYSKLKLHDAVKNLLSRPDVYKRFMQRFIDEYWKLNEGNLLHISELETLGIKTKIL